MLSGLSQKKTILRQLNYTTQLHVSLRILDNRWISLFNAGKCSSYPGTTASCWPGVAIYFSIWRIWPLPRKATYAYQNNTGPKFILLCGLVSSSIIDNTFTQWNSRPFTRSQDHVLISPKPPLENADFWRSVGEHTTTCTHGLSGFICAVPTGSMLPHYLVCGAVITHYWTVNRFSLSFPWFFV